MRQTTQSPRRQQRSGSSRKQTPLKQTAQATRTAQQRHVTMGMLTRRSSRACSRATRQRLWTARSPAASRPGRHPAPTTCTKGVAPAWLQLWNGAVEPAFSSWRLRAPVPGCPLCRICTCGYHGQLAAQTIISWRCTARREPLYCAAETACWWEVALLTQHVHPSVVAMARSLAGTELLISCHKNSRWHQMAVQSSVRAYLDASLRRQRLRRQQHTSCETGGASVVYDGDPLHDLALPAFLDKFVRRKGKVCASAVC